MFENETWHQQVPTSFASKLYSCRLFLSFLESNMLAELGTVFLEFYFTFNKFLVFTRKISLAGGFVMKSYKLDLGHMICI